jgi:serine/threonine protein kinase
MSTRRSEINDEDSDEAVEIKLQDLQPFAEGFPTSLHGAFTPSEPVSNNRSPTIKAVEETPEEIEAEMREAILREGLQLHVTSTGKQSIRTASGMPAELEALYDVGSRPIGKGKFSTVYKGVRKSDKFAVAVKQIAFFEIGDAKTREKRLKEIGLVQNLKHQHIIRYIDGFFESKQLCLIFEFAEAGDLKRQIKKAREKEARFDERVIWKYFSQVADAVQHLHSKRILHRDLKPANVFLTLQGTVKVGDLGLSRLLSENTLEAHSKVGTPLYMSPEVLKGRGYERSSDIWSLGCILYELALLKSPFKEEGLNLYELFRRITDPNFQYPPISDIYSFELRDLVDGMLMRDPNARPDIDEVVIRANAMRDSTAQAAREAAAKSAASQVAPIESSLEKDTSNESMRKIDIKSGGNNHSVVSNSLVSNPTITAPVASFSSLSIKTDHRINNQIAPPVSPIVPLPSITPIQLETFPPPISNKNGPSLLVDTAISGGTTTSLNLIELASLSPFTASELLCDRISLLGYNVPSLGHFHIILPHRLCFAHSLSTRSGPSSPFTIFVTVAQFLLTILGRSLPFGLFTSFTNGTAAPLSLTTAMLECSSSIIGSSQALSGITPSGLLLGYGQNVLRYLIWLSEIAIEPFLRTRKSLVAFQNTEWREIGSEISNDNIEETLVSDSNDVENEAILIGTRNNTTFQKEDDVDDNEDDNNIYTEVPIRSLIIDEKKANEKKTVTLSSQERKSDDIGRRTVSEENGEVIGGGVLFENVIDSTVWRAEVERVAPRLVTSNRTISFNVGYTSTTSQKDEWRVHLDQAFEATRIVESTLPTVQDCLMRNADELLTVCEVIDQREKRINASGGISSLTSELCIDSNRKTEMFHNVKNVQDRVSKLSNELEGINAALEEVKGELEEKGASLSDSSPLIRARAALLDLRAESKLLDRSIGVVSNAVMQHRIDHKKERLKRDSVVDN